MAEFSPVSNDVCVIKNCYRYKGVVLEEFVDKKAIQKISQMIVNPDDTFIVSYPRTGTTWTEKILSCLLEGVSIASTIDVEARFPFIEFTQPEDPTLPAYDGLKLAERQGRPRFLKTHLPANLLPDISGNGAKMIFILRDPRDTLISHYHFYRNIVWIKYNGSLEAMLDSFLSDQHVYGGYFNWYQGWAEKMGSGFKGNVHFLNFESMKRDLEGEIRKLAAFVGKSVSDTEVKQIAQVSGFDQMKKTVNIPGVPNFIRSGKVGEGKETLSEHQLARVDEALKRLKQKAPGLPLELY